MHTAWGLLLDAAEQSKEHTASGGGGRDDNVTVNDTESVGTSGCYVDAPLIYDIVDVGREFMSVAPCVAAYDALVAAKTPSSIQTANHTLSTLMDDVDQLLQTSAGFLLGAWLSDARAVATAAEGAHAEDADFLEWNARSQVTSWFPIAGDCDYNNKSTAWPVNHVHCRKHADMLELRIS